MIRSIARPARAPARAWRVVDIVVAAVLAVVCAVVFWTWSNLLYPVVATASVVYPPAIGAIGGGWLIAGTLGALLIRKPGAAIFCELLAAVLEGLMGTHFGWVVVIAGMVQGVAVELVFLLTGYRRFGLGAAVAGGAAAGLFLGVYGNLMSHYEWSVDHRVVYAALTTVSGALLAGVLMWLVMRALQTTGVLGGLAAGSSRPRQHPAVARGTGTRDAVRGGPARGM